MGPNDNDPIVTVQTSDGRTVRLPQSMAANFSGSLTPVVGDSSNDRVPTRGDASGDGIPAFTAAEAAQFAPPPDPAAPQSVIGRDAPPPPPETPPDRTVGFVDDGKFVPATAGPYITKLTPSDEQQFQQWVKTNKVPFDPSERADYDMRGFWQAARKGDPRAGAAVSSFDNQLHFPDVWKTPSHKTFSDESIYATSEAPSWQGDRLVDRNGKVIADETPASSKATANGEALQDYVTPNGETVRLPPSYAAQFSGLRPRGTTGDDLVKAGYGTVLDNQMQSLREGAAAGDEAAKNQQVYWAAKAAAIHDSNEREVAIEKQKAQEANERLARMDKLSNEVSANIEQLSNVKIDRSVAHPVLAALGLLLGAVGAAWAGKSENPAMTALQAQLDKNVQMQMEDQKNRWQGVNQKRDQINQLRQTFTDRNAYYDALSAVERRRAIAIGDEMMANSNRATAKTDWAQHRAQLGMQAANLQESAIGKEFDRRDHDRTYQMQAQNAASEDAARKSTARTAAGHLSLGWAEYEKAKKEHAEDMLFKYQQFEAAGQNQKAAAVQKQLEEDKKLGVSAPVATADKDGNEVRAVGMLRNKDGTVWHARDDKAASEIAKSIAAADDYNRITGQMIRGIAEHGGESDYLKSADWQRMRTMQQALVATLHEAYNVQSFRETTAEFFEKMATANVDPTSFVRNASAALRQSNKDLQAKINSRLSVETYDGPPVTFTDTSSPEKPEGSLEDIRFKKMIEKPDIRRAVSESLDRQGISARGVNIDPTSGSTWAAEKRATEGDKNAERVFNAKEAAIKEFNANGGTKGMLDSQRAAIDGQAQIMNDSARSVSDRSTARNLLQAAEEKGESPVIRSYAGMRLRTVPSGPEETSTRSYSTSHYEMPPLPAASTVPTPKPAGARPRGALAPSRAAPVAPAAPATVTVRTRDGRIVVLPAATAAAFSSSLTPFTGGR